MLCNLMLLFEWFKMKSFVTADLVSEYPAFDVLLESYSIPLFFLLWVSSRVFFFYRRPVAPSSILSESINLLSLYKFIFSSLLFLNCLLGG